MEPTTTEARVHYTCLVRLPFPRRDFVDPPPVEWDSSKDRSLWKVISKAANSKDLDWPELSNKFQVSLPFLLQQAAWLYERHFAQMKAQMKKLGASSSPTVGVQESPGSSTPAVGSVSAQRPGSRGSRAPSALSIHARDSPPPQSGSLQSPFVRGSAPPMSRTPSTRTVTQSRTTLPPSPRQPLHHSFRTSHGSHRRITPQLEDVRGEDESPPPAAPSSSSSSSSDEESQSVARSQAFRRPRNIGPLSSDGDADDDDDDESSGGFLPFAMGPNSSDQDPAATLRTSPPKRAPQRDEASTAAITAANANHNINSNQRRVSHPTVESSASSASSAAPSSSNRSAATDASRNAPSQHHPNQHHFRGSPADALSPRRRAELAKLSPRLRKDGSDGTPSMGSSFSDLDDASVTQSALEDALLSNMQHGSMASRMSTLSNAIKSKVLQ